MNVYLLFAINGWAGHSAILDAVMIFCAQYLIYGVFAAAAWWFIGALYKRNFKSAAYFALNLAVTFGLLQIASHAFMEQRPFVTYHLTQLVAHSADQSFPSDHTTAASAVAFGFILFTKFRKSGVTIFIVACLIGFARIFTGLHYPGDIGGAIVVAIAGAGVTFSACELFQRRCVTEDVS